MKKILFLIHDLGHGGAEKVLVNLVNNMDPEQFDITVMALFGGGVNGQFLKPHIRLINRFPKAFPGNSHAMKLLSPKALHKWMIPEKYDIEVAYLEGPAARIISGCPHKDTKKVAWIHGAQEKRKQAACSFRSYGEAMACYGRFDRIVGVSEAVQKDFLQLLPVSVPTQVLYNTNETAQIREKALESVEHMESGTFKLVGVGKLVASKGFDRLISLVKRMRDEGVKAHLYLLGEGALREKLVQQTRQLDVSDHVTFLGYQTNPYKYVAKCDLFVCASHVEGFSTAATEALIVGTPVCTVEVSGMKEMLGENNEWGIVTENDDESLCCAVRDLLTTPEKLAYYKKQATLRGETFSTEHTVKAVEEMLLNL